MKIFLMTAMAIILSVNIAIAAPQIGQPAPDFTGTDTFGMSHRLSDYIGKTVVLEWTNTECPYVGKHYSTGNMQAMQKAAAAKGIIWLTIASSAEGKQGYTTPEQANEYIKANNAQATARILDPSGEIGGLYEAKTTPHMFVINPEGLLVYEGAIDDDPKFKKDGMRGARNYVIAALRAIDAGQPVEVTQTQPYGCSVKY